MRHHILASLLLLASCATRAEFAEWARVARSGDLVPDSSTRAATLASGPVTAHVAIRHMPRLADVPGGLPIVIPPSRRPITGQPFTLGWTTRPTAPYANQPAALLVSFAPPGDAAEIPNGRGGMLQVPPQHVFRPGDVDWLTQQGGRIRLDYTFAKGLEGLRIWLQLVVKDPVAGVLTSPVVSLTVGDR